MALVFKTSVANFAALPAVGNTDGDLRRVADTGLAYRWDEDSTTWVAYTTVPTLETSDAIGLVGALTSDVDALAAESGDISAVVAGTGLTGGGTSGSVTLNVDVGTTANKIVQLDGTGKLPAVDGSQLTNLPIASGDITEVTAGTGLTGGGTTGAVTLNVDVGTTANKIVQLDGTAKLPAVDGSQLTNLAAPANAVTFTEYTYDFGVSGGAQGTITLGTIPDNRLVVAAHVVTLTTLASATNSAQVEFFLAGESPFGGNPPGNYDATAVIQYGSVTEYKVTGGNGDVTIDITLEDLTAGKCRVIVASVPFTP